MRKVKKATHQFLRNVVTGSLVAVLLVAVGGGIMKNIVLFMLTGIIEGTGIVVPVWGMFAVYAGILIILLGDRALAYFVVPQEKPKASRRLTRPAAPRRRYSH